VRVPFGRQKLVGIVMEAAASSDVPAERLKPILEVLDPRPVLDASALALLRWAAEYYHHPVGEVLSTALPKAMRMGAAAEAHEERWSVTPDGREAWAQGEPRRAPRQRELLGYLVKGGGGATAADEAVLALAHKEPSASAHDGASASADEAHFESAYEGVSAPALDEALPNWREAARSLAARGWVLSAEVPLASGEARFAVKTPGPALRDEQRIAVDAVGDALGHFGAFVLHGVTGSG
jgi:primosomal protein N' (replication factor Y)